MTASPQSRPAIVLVSHGSRDPAAGRTTEQIRATLATRYGEVPVVVSYLDFDQPRLSDALLQLGESGHQEVRVVPMLFTAGHHVTHDVTTEVVTARLRAPALQVTVAPPLHPIDDEDIAGQLLMDALDERLADVPRTGQIDGLVLLAAGSSDAGARASVDEIARAWGARHGLPALAVSASGPGATVASTTDRLRRADRHVLVAGSLFVAPGLLVDRARTDAREAGIESAEPLGATPAFVQLLARRVGALDPAAC